MKVTVKKLTNEDLMREACGITFLGKSKQSLLSVYKSEHSPARTQMFWITCDGIKLASATHLIRHHVGSQPYQLTCRDDRNGGNAGAVERLQKAKDDIVHAISDIKDVNEVINVLSGVCGDLTWLQENSDRNTPVNLGILVNAQSLIDMGKLRECMQAHKETREVFAEIKAKITEVDPDLAKMMVKKCVYRGGICGEPKCCGYNNTLRFKADLTAYLDFFSDKQKGIAPLEAYR